jgi:hypothetical protein
MAAEAAADWPHTALPGAPGRAFLCGNAPAQPAGLAETGRGLHVIAALADTWGCTPPSRTGKTVWALFTLNHHSGPSLNSTPAV